MIADLSKPLDLKKARTYFDSLCEGGNVITLTKKSKKRSLKSNAYLHVCITLFAIEYGYSLDEAKTHLKRTCPWMRYEKNGEVFLTATSKMDTADMAKFIEWIITHAGANGLFIPSSDMYLLEQDHYDKHIESHKQYM